MAASGGGSIIMVSSASVRALLNNHAAYIGTKAGGEALVRCFANEFGNRGVRVNALAPGLTSTPMTEDAVRLPGLEEAFLKEYPLGRIGTTQDVANAALWLAGDECFMTGEVLQVNGGLTLAPQPDPAGDQREHARREGAAGRDQAWPLQARAAAALRQFAQPVLEVTGSCGARAHRGRASGNSRPCRP